jgi:hypothetical protein
MKITLFSSWISHMFARKHLLPQLAIKQVTDTFILKGINGISIGNAFECYGMCPNVTYFLILRSLVKSARRSELAFLRYGHFVAKSQIFILGNLK